MIRDPILLRLSARQCAEFNDPTITEEQRIATYREIKVRQEERRKEGRGE